MPADKDSAKSGVPPGRGRLVADGMTVGLGSGSTAALMVRAPATRIQGEGLKIIGVADQCGDRRTGRSLEIPLRELDEVGALDINLDGADEIDPQFRMIKGRGGRCCARRSWSQPRARRVTMITADKRVEQLGQSSPIPVEVSVIGDEAYRATA